MGDKETTPEEIQAWKKELEEIKNDRMRAELEEIKRERLQKELEEIKREREQGTTRPQARAAAPKSPWPAIAVLLGGALLLVAAGFVLGNMFVTDVAQAIDDLIKGYGLPVGASAILICIAIILGFAGLWLVASWKR